MFPDLARYIILGIILVVTIPLPLQAAELKLIPGLSVKEDFNDNIFLGSSNTRQSDNITTLSPSLEISKATERGNAGLLTGVNSLIYARDADQNAVDFFAQGWLSHKLDERLSISAGAGYTQDSRRDQIDQNGSVLKSGSEIQNYKISGSYAVSEKSTASASYAYSQLDYDNQLSGSIRSHTVNIGQDYDLDRYLRQAKLVGNFGYFRSHTGTSQADNYAVTAGLAKKLHELWDVSLNAGGNFTHSESDFNSALVPNSQEDDLGFIANIAVNYSGEKTNGSLALHHDVIPTSNGNGGAAITRTGVSTNVSTRFTRDFSGFCGAGYSHNKSIQNFSLYLPTDEDTVSFSGGLRYEFSRYVSLDGTYLYNYIYYNNTSSHVSQNVFSLRLTMRRDIMGM